MTPSESLFDVARCIVCVGPGGVGKTSCSAAIAMQAALEGKRTIVLTIDPARRLANALGLPEIGNDERDVDGEAFSAAGLPTPPGRLTAMMLDIKQTWDDVIGRYHPDVAARERLLSNRLYASLSSALAGSQEYMAMEKLHALSTRTEDPLEVIVLDTPPANHAVDFLEAPSRVLNALDNDATKWLTEPYRERGTFSKRIFDAGSSFFVRTISRFTGPELLEELAELLTGFQGMFEGFKERARATREILEAADTRFLVVSTPEGVAEALGFHERLREREIGIGGVLLNKAAFDPFGDSPPTEAALSRALPEADALRRTLLDVSVRLRARAEAHAAVKIALEAAVAPDPVILVPELPQDVHDLHGLNTLREHIFGGTTPRG